MCGMTSWATCGSGLSRTLRLEDDQEEKNNDRDKQMGLNRQEKAEIGKRCKTILNWGRLEYLKLLGFECFLHYYVEPCISLENVCIVAVRNKK